jgi:hypothetical protein
MIRWLCPILVPLQRIGMSVMSRTVQDTASAWNSRVITARAERVFIMADLSNRQFTAV